MTKSRIETLTAHFHGTAKANLPRCPTNEADTVRVHRLMNGGGTTGRARQWDLAAALNLCSDLPLSTLTQVFDDRGLHCELDEVEWQEPDDVLFDDRSACERYMRKYPSHTQTQTIPIHAPEIEWIFVNPQSAKAAMMEETSWAIQNAPIRAYEGRSMKQKPCDRVTKIRACEMIAT